MPDDHANFNPPPTGPVLTSHRESAVPTNQPRIKLVAATGAAAASGALATLLVFGLETSGITLPVGVKEAIMTLITTLGTFMGGWLMPPGAGETAILQDGRLRSAVLPS